MPKPEVPFSDFSVRDHRTLNRLVRSSSARKVLDGPVEWRKNGCVRNGYGGHGFRVSDFDFGSQNWRNGEINLIATFGGRCFRDARKGQRIATGFGDFDRAAAARVAPFERQRYAVEHCGRVPLGFAADQGQYDGGVAREGFDRKCHRPVSGDDISCPPPFRLTRRCTLHHSEAIGLGFDLSRRQRR